MVVNNDIELRHLENRISIYNRVLNCLQIRMFYLRNKRHENEFAENENELKLIRTESEIQKTKMQLMFLKNEHSANFEIYKAIIDDSRQRDSNITADAQ